MERPKFSEMLADRRRQLGYSIRQASRVLRMREDVLIAFEEGDFDLMPKSGYAQGMLSSYARYLGLNPSMVVDAYIHDLDRNRREERRRGRSRGGAGSGSYRSGQPYVAPRRLLPTSGGPAGDMGSFATTRVHSRSGGQSESSSSAHEDVGSRDPQNAYPQGRPYTGRTPTRTRRSGGSSRRRNEISTMEVAGYDDDLRLGRDARPFDAASSRTGRRSSRNISNSQRPRIDRRSRQAGRSRDDRGRGGGRRDPAGGGLLGGLFSHAGILIVCVVIVVLSLIIILSVNSCIRQGTDSARTVPVSEASKTTKSSTSAQTDSVSIDSSATDDTSSTSSKDDASSTSSKDDASSTSSKDDTSSTSSKSSSNKETSVSVSVADGEVTWLEIECDGKSDIAQTTTGPWQKTYTVDDAISIQAGNTTAVSVVQDGRQVQFDSMASGIGSIRIQGSKTSSSSSKDTKSTKSDDTKDDANSTSSDGASSAKIGNASSSDSSGSTSGTKSSGSSDEDDTNDDSGSLESESGYEY